MSTELPSLEADKSILEACLQHVIIGSRRVGIRQGLAWIPTILGIVVLVTILLEWIELPFFDAPPSLYFAAAWFGIVFTAWAFSAGLILRIWVLHSLDCISREMSAHQGLVEAYERLSRENRTATRRMVVSSLFLTTIWAVANVMFYTAR